jgi:glutamyl-Q tRNA(Asp) synthetase
LFAWRLAKDAGGHFLLRIEDIDRTRCRPEHEAAILEDLHWLGLDWAQPVLRQSDRMAIYDDALAALEIFDLLYPCFCTRKDIAREIADAGHAPHGPDGPVYPGTCRMLDPGERAERVARGDAYALRLKMDEAMAQTGPLRFFDRTTGDVAVDAAAFGDVVLARKDVPTSYHLSVVVDDAAQGVTLVSRGEDLLPATHIHRVLQELLGLPTPEYAHHPLLTDASGRRFAKRDRSETIAALREAGKSPEAVRALAGMADLPL